MWVRSCALDLFIFYVLCSSACQLQVVYFIIMAAKPNTHRRNGVDENEVINRKTSPFSSGNSDTIEVQLGEGG